VYTFSYINTKNAVSGRAALKPENNDKALFPDKLNKAHQNMRALPLHRPLLLWLKPNIKQLIME